MGERRAEAVWDSIALHTTSSIAQHKSTDVACCQNGITCDYGGLGYNELSDDNKKVILSTYPRLGMKNELTTCLCGIVKNHPNTGREGLLRTSACGHDDHANVVCGVLSLLAPPAFEQPNELTSPIIVSGGPITHLWGGRSGIIEW